MPCLPFMFVLMIFGPVISWPFLLLVFVLPLVGAAVAISLLVQAWYFHRHGEGGWRAAGGLDGNQDQAGAEGLGVHGGFPWRDRR